MHRLALIADVGLLMFIGVFLCRAEASYLRALLRTSLHHPVGLTFTALLLAGATAFSLFVATVPGEAMDEPASAPRQAGEGRYVFGYAVPQLAGAEAPLLGLFHRNLSVSDVSLLPDKEVRADAVSINLRGRDLRFANLDRADLRQADLTGANLEGASLAGADLRGAAMGCFEPPQLQQGDNPRAARCTSARGANLFRSRLSGARMSGIDLRGARLEEARIEDARLDHAVMVGANFTAAGLDRADLTGAWLYGAAFARASLQGADLSRARLQMADLSGAALQGASLASASLEAASLRDADLDGANLQMARLYGADLTGARLQGSDMKAAYIWRTAPPVDGLGFSDLAQIIVQPPAEDQLTAFAALARLQSGALKTRAADGLAALADAAQNGAWSASSEQQAWQGLAKASEAAMADGYRARLTDYLARLACRPRFAGGAVATGVARRATAQGFRGDAAVLYDRLRGADCPAATAVNARTMRDLAAAADAAREAGPPISVPAPPAPVPAQPRAP